MVQKLIKVGNSKALTISKDILKQLGNTDMAKVQFDPSKKRLIVDFDQQEVTESIVDPEVYKIAKNILKRYNRAFAELAKK